MADVCSVDIVIKAEEEHKLIAIEAILKAWARDEYGERNVISFRDYTDNGSSYALHDCSIVRRRGDTGSEVAVACWTHWSFDYPDVTSFIAHLGSKTQIYRRGVTMDIYYEELGSDQFGVYHFDGYKLTDSYLSPFTIDALRAERDAYDGDEDTAFDMYHDALVNALKNGESMTSVVHIFSECRKGNYDEDKCPKCSSDDIDTDPVECDSWADGSVIWLPTTCNKCGHRFNQLYRLEFLGTENRGDN